MIRSITETEKDYVDANMAIYTRFCVNKAYTFDSTVQAVAHLLKKHPLLRAVIHNSTYHEKSSLDAEKYVEKVEFIPNDERLFSFKLKDQLFKVIFSTGNDFIFIVHHAIADAIAAVQLVNDFVQPDNTSLPVPLSIEHYYDSKPSFEETKAYAAAFQQFLHTHKRASPPLNQPELPYDQVKARMRSFEIEVKNILQAAKNSGVSVHSYLTGCFIKSFNLNGLVCIGTAVDLRRRLKKAIPEGLISAPAGAFVFIEVERDHTVAEIAKLYQEKLLAHINSADLLLQHYAILRGELNPLEFDASFFLSNAGQAEVATSVTHLSFSAEALMNRPYLACITHLGKMVITVTYPDPWIPSSMIERMIQLVQ